MTTRIRCGALLDGTGTGPRPDREILIDGDTIRAVRGTTMAKHKADGDIDIDLSGHFVMPGFIDAHSHLSIIPSRGDQLGQLRQPAGQQALRVAANIRKDLKAGTTTLRVMGEEDWLDVYARDAIREGMLDGPDLVIATRGLAATNGHGRAKVGFDGVDEVRKGARQNLEHGADFLKVFATGGVSSGTGLGSAMYSSDELRVVVEEAERKGTYVAAHAHGGPGLVLSAEAGVRTIEHAALASDADIDVLRHHTCWVIATLGILFHPEGIAKGDAAKPDIIANLEAARDRVVTSAHLLFQSGLRVALGTDSMHGGMAYEIQTAIKFGLDPLEALHAATRQGAEALRVADRTGTIEAGKAADIIALDGDPLVDPSALERVVFVMKGGRQYDG